MPTVSSSFSSNERLPKFADPMMLKIRHPIALVCIIVAIFEISIPLSSIRWIVVRLACFTAWRR